MKGVLVAVAAVMMSSSLFGQEPRLQVLERLPANGTIVHGMTFTDGVPTGAGLEAVQIFVSKIAQLEAKVVEHIRVRDDELQVIVDRAISGANDFPALIRIRLIESSEKNSRYELVLNRAPNFDQATTFMCLVMELDARQRTVWHRVPKFWEDEFNGGAIRITPSFEEGGEPHIVTISLSYSGR